MSTLFLKILNMSITAGWLILAVMITRWILRRATRRIICLLWVFVAVRLVLPLSLPSPISLIPNRQPIPESIITATEQENEEPVTDMATSATDQEAHTSNEATEFNTPETLVPAVNPDPSIDLNTAASANPWQAAFSIASIVWVVGICAMLLYAVIHYLKLKKSLAASIEYREAGTDHYTGQIRICDEIKAPFILGILHPVLYIPSGLNGQALEYVLQHEQAHLRRKDYLWKPLGYLILTIHWFNPLCWAAYLLFCQDVEMACDEAVIWDMDREHIADYMRTLLACSQSNRLNAATLAFGEVGVKRRIRNIAQYKKPAFGAVAAIIVVSLGMAACLMTDPIDKNVITGETSYKVFVTQAERPFSDDKPYVNDRTRLYHFMTRDGSAFAQGTDLLQYMEKGSNDWHVLCKDSDCLHASEDCPAYYVGRHEILDIDSNNHIRVLEFANAGHQLVIWKVNTRTYMKDAAASFDLDELSGTRKDGSIRLSDFCEYNDKLYLTYPAEEQNTDITWLIRIDLKTFQADNIVSIQPSMLPVDYSVIHRFEYVEDDIVYLMLENAVSGQMRLYGFDMEQLEFADTGFELAYGTSYCLAGPQAVYIEQDDEQCYLVKTDVLTGESTLLADTFIGTKIRPGTVPYLGFVNVSTWEHPKSTYYQLNMNTAEMTEYYKAGSQIYKSSGNGYAAYLEYEADYSYKLAIKKAS